MSRKEMNAHIVVAAHWTSSHIPTNKPVNTQEVNAFIKPRKQ